MFLNFSHTSRVRNPVRILFSPHISSSRTFHISLVRIPVCNSGGRVAIQHAIQFACLPQPFPNFPLWELSRSGRLLNHSARRWNRVLSKRVRLFDFIFIFQCFHSQIISLQFCLTLETLKNVNNIDITIH